MPQTLTELPVSLDVARISRRLWTRADIDVLAAAGRLDPNQYELIEGELVEKMPKRMRHVRALMLLIEWLKGVFGFARVAPEATLDLSNLRGPVSEPEPDIIVLRRSALDVGDCPLAEDVDLIIEISVTTLGLDLTVKSRLYARAGVREYWIVDIPGRRFLVHREPGPEGTYQLRQEYKENESVSPLAASDSALAIAKVFQFSQ